LQGQARATRGGTCLAKVTSEMIAGTQGLVSSMQAQWQRHEILANNLANAATTGFKRDDIVPLPGAQVPPGAVSDPSNPALASMFQWTDFSQGEVRPTGRPLDVALDGNGFLVVQTPRGERYTRAGALGINAEGNLITSGGHVVLGTGGPIAARGSITVSPDGQISDGTGILGTLKVVDFPRPYRLVKEGGGLFAPADASAVPQPVRNVQIVGGALEASNINPVETMVSMIEVLRKYESLQRTLQAVDEANGQSTSEIGKV
jgi:flagellar basal body rod protein FlgG